MSAFDQIWTFLRGDATVEAFAEWAYAAPDLEALLGPALYHEVISADYSSSSGVWELRRKLRAAAEERFDRPCECIKRGSHHAIIDMGGDGDDQRFFASMKVIRNRGEPYWWLYLSQCQQCGQFWLVAQEERQNDIYILNRIIAESAEAIVTGQAWPDDFAKYEMLLRIGRDSGRRWKFADPLGSKSLFASVVDLARERPGISVAEFASLLNLEDDIALQLARRAVRQERVTISGI